VSGKTGQGGSGGRLRGPEQILVTDGELDVRDDLGTLHVRSLSAELAKQGDCQVSLSDVTVDPTSGAVRKAEKVQLVWQESGALPARRSARECASITARWHRGDG
jgi:hypothetical protein